MLQRAHVSSFIFTDSSYYGFLNMVPLLHIVWYFASIHILYGSRDEDLIHTFQWNRQEDYYFTDMKAKFKLMDRSGQCQSNLVLLPPNTYALHTSENQVVISSFEVEKEVFEWWRALPPPKQHRVDPLLCRAPYSKKKPIFTHSGSLIITVKSTFCYLYT